MYNCLIVSIRYSWYMDDYTCLWSMTEAWFLRNCTKFSGAVKHAEMDLRKTTLAETIQIIFLVGWQVLFHTRFPRTIKLWFRTSLHLMKWGYSLSFNSLLIPRTSLLPDWCQGTFSNKRFRNNLMINNIITLRDALRHSQEIWFSIMKISRNRDYLLVCNDRCSSSLLLPTLQSRKSVLTSFSIYSIGV
jgi:hypothetical protein